MAAVARVQPNRIPSPRRLRDGVRSGVWTFRSARPPSPPVEWKAWKRAALQRCIDAAAGFYRDSDPLEAIRLNRIREVTKQRVQQDIVRGTRYLIEEGWLYRVHRT